MKNYQNMVFSTAMRLTANPSEAEDISQEVFLKAYQRFDQLRDSPAVGGWLKTVATHLSLKHLSRYRSRWSFFSELFAGNNQEDVPAEPEFAAPDEFDAELARADRQEWVEEALQKLPVAQRVPLVLFHMEGMSYQEIASKLGSSLGKVKTDIFRARAVLRKRLRERWESENAISPVGSRSVPEKRPHPVAVPSDGRGCQTCPPSASPNAEGRVRIGAPPDSKG